jgi:hypothetical protein
MSLDIRFLYDAGGWRRAQVAPPHQMVGDYLEADVQGCPETAIELLQAIDRVLAREALLWEGTGNAHYLRLAGDEAVIENIWLEDLPTCRIPLTDFRCAVSGWLEFIRKAGGRT